MTADAERLAAIRERVEAALAAERPPFRTHFSDDDFGGDSSNLDDVTEWTFDRGIEWGEHSILVGAAAYLLAEHDTLQARIEAATAVTDEYDEGGDRKPGHEECAGDVPCEACWLNEEYRAALAGVQPKATPEPRAVTEAERMSLEAMRFRQGLPSAFDFNSPRSGI